MTDANSKEMFGHLNNLTDHELLLLMTQSLVRVEERIFVIEGKLDSKADKGLITALEQKSVAYDNELEKIEKLIEKNKDLSHTELENCIKDLEKQISDSSDKQDKRLIPLESFKTFLLGAISTNGILTVILCGLVIYIITGK